MDRYGSNESPGLAGADATGWFADVASYISESRYGFVDRRRC
jgi:hypothetical protein